jgi:hypothetical protein
MTRDERNKIMADAQGMIIENIQDTITPGLTVYDSEGKKVGTVLRIHRIPGYFQVQASPFSQKDLHVPFRLITNIDARELYVSVSRDKLHRDYANPPPRSTQVEDEDGTEMAVTTEPSGYDGAPIVVRRARVNDLRRAITAGARVFTSDPTELGTVKHYDPATGWIWITRSNEPGLRVPVAIVDVVDGETHEVHLVSSEADLERLEHLEPA